MGSGRQYFELFLVVVVPLDVISEYVMVPEVQVAYVGQPVSISCPFPSALWKLDWQPLRRDVRVELQKVSIKRVSELHHGVYSCTNRRTGETLTSMLRVGYRDSSRVTPRIRKQDDGTVAKFKCSSSSDIQWYLNFGMVRKGLHVLGADSVIQLTVSADLGGRYLCYGYDMGSRRFFLSEGILIPIVQANIMPPIHAFHKQKSLMIFCKTLVSPATRWTFNNGPLPDNAAPDRTNKQQLIISRPKDSNIGFYECIGVMNTSRFEPVNFAAIAIVIKDKKSMNEKKLQEMYRKIEYVDKNDPAKVEKWRWLLHDNPHPKSIVDLLPAAPDSFSLPYARRTDKKDNSDSGSSDGEISKAPLQTSYRHVINICLMLSKSI